MPRRRTPKKRIVNPDPFYDSQLVHMIVKRLMKKGKKSLAYKLFYQSMNQLAEMTQQDPLVILEQAIRNATPLLEVKARRVGGSTYQVPVEVDPQRGTTLAIRWILGSCRNKSGKSMISKLTSEFFDASQKTGNAIRKRDEMHKMADANQAFAKYRF